MSFSARLTPGSIGYALAQANLATQAADALSTIQGASGALLDIKKQLRADISAAWNASANDTNLSTEGRRNRETELTIAAQQRAQQAVADLRQRVLAATDTITSNANRFRPKPAAGVEALLNRQAIWHRLRHLLDSNGTVTPRRLVQETTDVETLFTLRDELPVYARSQGTSAESAAQITAAIDQQLATTTSPEAQAALAAEQAAAVTLAGLVPRLGSEQQATTGSLPTTGGLAGAIASEMAQQQARAVRSWQDQPPQGGNAA